MALSSNTSYTSEQSWQDTNNPKLNEMEDTRNKLADLFNTIDQTYVNLINAGRQAEASQLREAAEGFSRTGSQMGVNAFARQAACQRLANTLRTTGGLKEAQIEAGEIDQKAGLLKELSGMDQNILSQAMSMKQDLRSSVSQQNRQVQETGAADPSLGLRQIAQAQAKAQAQTAANRALADAQLKRMTTQGQSVVPSNPSMPSFQSRGGSMQSGTPTITPFNQPATFNKPFQQDVVEKGYTQSGGVRPQVQGPFFGGSTPVDTSKDDPTAWMWQQDEEGNYANSSTMQTAGTPAQWNEIVGNPNSRNWNITSNPKPLITPSASDWYMPQKTNSPY